MVGKQVLGSLFDKDPESTVLPPGQLFKMSSLDQLKEGVKVYELFTAFVNTVHDNVLNVFWHWIPQWIVFKNFFETIDWDFTVRFAVRFLGQIQ